jgi:hypothetical protein
MNAFAFLLAAVLYVFLTFFVYWNYPRRWKENRTFRKVLLLWHFIGLASIIPVFTCVRDITHENIRYEICRLATFYYIPLTLMTILYLILQVYTRAYRFIIKYTGATMSPRAEAFLVDKKFFAVFFTVISFGICIAGYFNIDFLHSREYEVKVNAKSAQPELTVCLIADVHAGTGTWEYIYDDLADRIDACNADVLLLAGDVFDETTAPDDVENVAWLLSTIKKPRYGMYYVYGNHDDSREDWAAEQLRQMGVITLNNEMTVLGEDIQLFGIQDSRRSVAEIREMFENARPDPQKPILAMIHRPTHFRDLSALGCDLVTAGHTHGFNIPAFIGGPLFGDMFSGIESYGKMTAVTTSGVSAWGFHYKWPAESEVVKIHLTFDPLEE